ncbi:MAG: nuclear transport factor 2 family protein [Clostridiales bacterium]|nr:nuclear transport factor 2 family protein [Clostridiales bacterium]
MILTQYVERMNNKDAKGIAELFAQDCLFNDGGGRPWGFDDIVVNSRDGVYNVFADVLASNDVKATIIKLNNASMEYDVQFGDILMPCVGTVTINEDSLISEYIVRPR